jgi:hypothetical protein
MFIFLSLSSCGIGGHWMTGDPFYKPDIKPYMNYWQKQDMTSDSRLHDWQACGGNYNGTFSWKTKEQIPGESNEEARTRQEFAFQHCLIDKGYHYTGDCSSDYMLARPLCAEP